MLSSTGWLPDVMIDAAQMLLAEQFNMSGLQSVTLGLVMQFNIHRGEFLQILSTQDHWVTVSTIGVQTPGKVQVFDSLYDIITDTVQAQIASILCTQKSSIEVEVMNVQKQVSTVMHAYNS